MHKGEWGGMRCIKESGEECGAYVPTTTNYTPWDGAYRRQRVGTNSF